MFQILSVLAPLHPLYNQTPLKIQKSFVDAPLIASLVISN